MGTIFSSTIFCVLHSIFQSLDCILTKSFWWGVMWEWLARVNIIFHNGRTVFLLQLNCTNIKIYSAKSINKCYHDYCTFSKGITSDISTRANEVLPNTQLPVRPSEHFFIAGTTARDCGQHAPPCFSLLLPGSPLRHQLHLWKYWPKFPTQIEQISIVYCSSMESGNVTAMGAPPMRVVTFPESPSGVFDSRFFAIAAVSHNPYQS